jgi:hypothetical protein
MKSEHIKTFEHCIYPRNARKTVTVNGLQSICNDRMEKVILGPEFILKLVLKYKDR